MATTLTREQRIEAYTYALFYLLAEETKRGVCVILYDWEMLEFGEVLFMNDLGVRRYYPEFAAQKPSNKKYGDIWFDTQDDRITALCRAIEKAEKSKA